MLVACKDPRTRGDPPSCVVVVVDPCLAAGRSIAAGMKKVGGHSIDYGTSSSRLYNLMGAAAGRGIDRSSCRIFLEVNSDGGIGVRGRGPECVGHENHADAVRIDLSLSESYDSRGLD